MSRILCAGGGPAGLYLAILLRTSSRDHDVTVCERHARGYTEGWGITLWEELLQDIAASDPTTAEQIRARAVRWQNHILLRNGRRVFHPGRGGYSIGRHALLEVLTQRAEELGAELRFSQDVSEVECDRSHDLLVACDGVRSRIRQQHAEALQARVVTRRNKYIWLGVNLAFEGFIYAIENTAAGAVWFYGYPFSVSMSTCVVECAPETWQALGFDRMSPDQSIEELNQIFAKALKGQQLLSGGSTWQSFRQVTNGRWHCGNIVLLGDAAHTTHFSIGAGTRLALEDAKALATKLRDECSISKALEAYSRERPLAIRQLQSEARFSLEWWEKFARYDTISDDETFFKILRERRSPLLARIPPRTYHVFHQVSQTVPALSKLRNWIGPRARSLYSRFER